MDDLPARVRAVCDLDVAEVREYAGATSTTAGSRTCPRRGAGRPGPAGRARPAGPPLADPHDEAHLAAFEARAEVVYGDLELHRRNPLLHLAELDLACYDREYAPAERAGPRPGCGTWPRGRRRWTPRWPRSTRSARRWRPRC